MRLSTSDVGLRTMMGLACLLLFVDCDEIMGTDSVAIAGKLARMLTTRVRQILANEFETEFDIYFIMNISTTIIQMLNNPFKGSDISTILS
jgi:hypothetical protein